MSYIVTVFVPGPSLEEWLRCNRGGASPQWAARVVADLARGIDHAHVRGILHRDLKPANVLLHVPECDGEPASRRAWEQGCAASWTPRICDFGMARLQEVDGTGTRSRMVCGSPPYMAPEQAESRQDEIGPATDVYGLGAILYELLTGRPPFAGASELETLRQVVADEPAQPSRVRPGLPRDLETICLKCLSKRTTSRYRGALALSEDLERFVNGQPIQARPPTPWSRAWRWLRRNVVLATSAALAVVTAVGTARRRGLLVESGFSGGRHGTRQGGDAGKSRDCKCPRKSSLSLHRSGLGPIRFCIEWHKSHLRVPRPHSTAIWRSWESIAAGRRAW